MADGTSKEPEKENPPRACMGCGGLDNIKKPFDHEDAHSIFWCGTCGTLINAIDENKMDAMVPRLSGAVFQAMTGYKNAEELASVHREKAAENTAILKAKRAKKDADSEASS